MYLTESSTTVRDIIYYPERFQESLQELQTAARKTKSFSGQYDSTSDIASTLVSSGF